MWQTDTCWPSLECIVCVLMLEHHALLFFLTLEPTSRAQTAWCGGKGVFTHTRTNTHTLAGSQGFFQHRLCVSLVVCQSNQAESCCGIVGFYLQFPALSHAHMNRYRIIQAKYVYYNLCLKCYLSLYIYTKIIIKNINKIHLKRVFFMTIFLKIILYMLN